MKRLGKQTYILSNPVSILESASIVGPKESNGPLASYFDKRIEDEFYGEESWEKAESKFIKDASNTVINKSGISLLDIDACFAGDLLNQCISSNFGLKELNIPMFGIFGACSTFAESLILGSIGIDGGFFENVLCAVSSHFCSAEKQFRFPLELGTQRPPSAQWTVTGSGACILSNNGKGPYITSVTPRKNSRFRCKRFK